MNDGRKEERRQVTKGTVTQTTQTLQTVLLVDNLEQIFLPLWASSLCFIKRAYWYKKKGRYRMWKYFDLFIISTQLLLLSNKPKLTSLT